MTDFSSLNAAFLDPLFPGYEKSSEGTVGIYTRDYIETNGVAGFAPQFLTAAGDLFVGDAVTLADGGYTVAEVQLDGAGMQIAILEAD